MVTLQLRQLDIPPGQRLLIHHLSWPQFEQVLAEMGDRRSSRLAYHQGTLEIRMPLPQHERHKSILGDVVKLLLEELAIDCECFGSTTFKRQDMDYGIEPDECFYIQNYRAMIGKDRIDLRQDPPPDLAIEVDVTSKTQRDAYVALGVPELWVYNDQGFQIYLLQGNTYQAAASSPLFPGLPIIQWVTAVVAHSDQVGRSAALRALRQQLQTEQPFG